LEKQAGIQVKIFDGVPDKNVSIHIESLPIYCLNTLLQKMSLDNSAVIYDNTTEAVLEFRGRHPYLKGILASIRLKRCPPGQAGISCRRH
jgi:hypothetical protein